MDKTRPDFVEYKFNITRLSGHRHRRIVVSEQRLPSGEKYSVWIEEYHSLSEEWKKIKWLAWGDQDGLRAFGIAEKEAEKWKS
jgi:hypothetical protein